MARSEQQQTTAGPTIRDATSHIFSAPHPGDPFVRGDVDALA